MAGGNPLEIRPRTTGEILDDGWRLYLSNLPLLLGLSGCFTVPLATALLLLLTLARPDNQVLACLLPALGASLVPLTGLGAGACQEAFRQLAEGRPARLRACLGAALHHGLDHVAARAIVWITSIVTSLCLVLPGLATLLTSACIHPILARGDVRLFHAWQLSALEAQRQPAKSLVVMLARPLLLLFCIVNLHLFVQAGLWMAENLAGFDVAFLAISLSLRNPVYVVVLVLISSVLLAPYGEAVNCLLHIDGQARFEGLDLWYRVQRLFPPVQKTRAGMLLLAVACALAFSARAGAADRLSDIQAGRKEIAEITREINETKPYPGSAHWVGRLQRLAERLESTASTRPGRSRWFHQALQRFAQQRRADALKILNQLDGKLALLEDSLARTPSVFAKQPRRLSTEELKNLLPPDGTNDNSAKEPLPDSSTQEKEEIKEPVVHDGDFDSPSDAGRPVRPGVLAPQPLTGLGDAGWMVVAGLLVALIIAGFVLGWKGRTKPRAKAQAAQDTRSASSLGSVVSHPDRHSVAGLWNHADDLARRGQWLEAVRILYLAVLALLHRENLIRYERNRTNGEYVQQLQARAALQQTFGRLTRLFEVKWYGSRTCEAEDYSNGRGLAELIRDEVKATD